MPVTHICGTVVTKFSSKANGKDIQLSSRYQYRYQTQTLIPQETASHVSA